MLSSFAGHTLPCPCHHRPRLRSGKKVRDWCEKAMLLIAKHESGAFLDVCDALQE